TGQQQRSVSFHASPASPSYRNYTAVRGADQRVARTAYDSATAGEARYRPYPEIPHMTQSALVQPGSDVLGAPSNDVVDGQSPSALAAAAAAASKRASEAQRRKRRTQACEYCHLKKIKCEGDGVR
ncbi:hypothetical protein GGI19_006206, partial [Coemansia pectinata]